MSSVANFESSKDFLNDILEDSKNCIIQLPEFQRDWVWDDEHVINLLSSISLSYPIGVIMMLNTGKEEIFLKSRPIEGINVKDEDLPIPEKLILDGQQRITALYLSLASNKPVNTWKTTKKNKLQRWYYIDIKKAMDPNVVRSEAILSIPHDKKILNFRAEVIGDYSTPEKEYEAGYFPLSKIFDYSTWRSEYNKYWKYQEEKVKLFDQFEAEILKRFDKYLIPTIILKKETPKEAVCQIFENVNTSGVPLNVFELLTATYATKIVSNNPKKYFNLREDWSDRLKKLKKHHIVKSIQNTDFLQAISLLSTYNKKLSNDGIAVSCKKKDILELPFEEYIKYADAVTKGFIEVDNILHSQKIFSDIDLPYRTQLVPFATILAFLDKNADKDSVRSKLLQWYWCGVLGELYGSAVETRFANDLIEVMNWINGGQQPSTVVDANFVQNRLLTLRTRNSAAYKGISALLIREGGEDFISGLAIDDQIYKSEKIDIHHIFPSAYCKDIIDINKCNCIINKTPLSARTNKIIGGKAPSIYLPKIQGISGAPNERMDKILSSHLIDPNSIRSDDFDTFFIRRQNEIIKYIEKAMGKGVAKDNKNVIPLAIEEDDEEEEES